MEKIFVDTIDGHGFPIGKFPLLVHAENNCDGTPCVIHNPSEHVLNNSPLLHQTITGILERVCVHGVAHPDPDVTSYQKNKGLIVTEFHTCDGCCAN